MEPEKRFFEFRAELPESGPARIEGALMPYGGKARAMKLGKTFTEEFRAGSIKAGLDDSIANIMHDRMKPVARSGAGLVLADTATELRASVEFPDTVHGREARELVRDGILRGFSIEFRAIDQEWHGSHRIITEAHILGLGIVDRPAYSGAQIEARLQELYGHHPASKIRYYY